MIWLFNDVILLTTEDLDWQVFPLLQLFGSDNDSDGLDIFQSFLGLSGQGIFLKVEVLQGVTARTLNHFYVHIRYKVVSGAQTVNGRELEKAARHL